MSHFNNLLIKLLRIKLKVISFFSKKISANYAFKLFCTPLKKKYPKLLCSKYAADILSFKLGNITIKGYRWNPGSGKKVLLVHGFSSSSLNFQHFVGPLASNGFEVFAFDAPAHGRSDGQQINALVYTEMIQHVVKLFGPINNFIAHSFGGLAVMLSLEKLSHNALTKVVLLAPATETTTAITDVFKLLDIVDPGVRREFDGIIYKLSGKAPEWFSIKRASRNIQAKILWLHDEGDTVTPFSDAINAVTANPENIEFIVTKGLGHRRIYKEDWIVRKVISFLSS